MITAEELTKLRSGRAVVSDVTFRCEPGTITRPSAVIGLRDAQTGDARATRVRQLATPSWLSTLPKRSSNDALSAARAARETVARTASSTWNSLPRPDEHGFSLALRAGAAMTY